MRRAIGLIIYATLAAGMVLYAGCSAPARLEPIVLGSPAMLFDGGGSAFSSTEFGRSPWPATPGGFDSLEETTFVESYHDFQGSASFEQTNPHQHFRSYRAGSRVR
ncbi:MAG: hypothetical protein ACE5EQ_06155 [Phycisphaerae bacterium]